MYDSADNKGPRVTVVAIYLVITFGLGGLAMALRLPPLVGFLAAGFVINALNVEDVPQLEVLADLGVTLLLFAIGLKPVSYTHLTLPTKRIV